MGYTQFVNTSCRGWDEADMLTGGGRGDYERPRGKCKGGRPIARRCSPFGYFIPGVYPNVVNIGAGGEGGQSPARGSRQTRAANYVSVVGERYFTSEINRSVERKVQAATH